jgi:coenzyme F420-reducing hydrogenase delta subunit
MVGVVTWGCVALLGPSLIDYILSKDLADGVVVAGCGESTAYNRLGIDWTKQRFAGKRDPYLRKRVPQERLLTLWASPFETARYDAGKAAFAESLRGMTKPSRTAARQETSGENAEDQS